jgi:hypothetical protein
MTSRPINHPNRMRQGPAAAAIVRAVDFVVICVLSVILCFTLGAAFASRD